jgi:ubiquinone/menaquinone biosynthesis C-methylase UbiE
MSDLAKIFKEWEKYARINVFKAIDSEAKDDIHFFARGKQIAQIILEDTNFFLIRPIARVLDLGAGIGRVARAIAMKSNNINVYGIDVSATMVELARKYNQDLPNLRFIMNDGKSIPFPNDYFDLVYSVLTFQHLPQYIMQLYLSEIWRVLKPNGLLWLQIPRTTKITRPHFLLVVASPYIHRVFATRRHKDLSFTRYYSKKEIKLLLNSFGFYTIKYRYVYQGKGSLWLCVTCKKRI